MRENPRIYNGQSKNGSKFDTRTRGPSPAERGFDKAAEAVKTPTARRWSAPLPDAVATSLAIHRIWVNNWGSLNQYCATALSLARPFYVFPLELMPQYFSFIFGCPPCASTPAVRLRPARHTPEMRDPLPDFKPGPVDGNGQCEEMQRAMDVAIGATTELWVELIHEGTGPEQEKTKRKPVALVAAA